MLVMPLSYGMSNGFADVCKKGLQKAHKGEQDTLKNIHNRLWAMHH